jgi:hypothetical protein
LKIDKLSGFTVRIAEAIALQQVQQVQAGAG